MVKLAALLLRYSGWYGGYWNHWRTMFPYLESRDLHVLPAHYYSPIPDTRNLPEELWQELRMPSGFELNAGSALVLLENLGRQFGAECGKFAKKGLNGQTYDRDNTAYLPVDAAVLYSMVRKSKPKSIIEIGSGHSTLVICEAIRAIKHENPEYHCDFTCIEPYPPQYLVPPPPEVTQFESKAVQQVSSGYFARLGPGDILFVDSTHVARIGSDVIYEYLTILPSLAQGVLVHIHDIFIPAEYPKDWIYESRLFWNEQYLLEAFLTNNNRFKVVLPTHFLWLQHKDLFRGLFAFGEPGRVPPSSFWIERC